MDTPPDNTNPINTVPPTASESTVSEHPRPHCRGCMADCPNYTTCDGMPWRKAE